jgi:magnesium chelatase subunit D
VSLRLGIASDALSEDAYAAAALLAVAGGGLGGVLVRSRADPLLDVWLRELQDLFPEAAPFLRVPNHVDESRLFGGLDLAATLAAKRPQVSRGLLAQVDGGALIVTHADRLPNALAAQVAQTMDRGLGLLERDGLSATFASRFALVLIDEGASAEEAAPRLLADRVGLVLRGLHGDRGALRFDRAAVMAARRTLVEAPFDDGAVAQLWGVADAMGVGSVRAVGFAFRAAQAWAALAGRSTTTEADLVLAARLVLAPRADPASAPAEPPEAQEQPDEVEAPPSSKEPESSVERIVEAVRAALPADLLAQLLSAETVRRVGAASAGGGRIGPAKLRGRPIGSRPGRLRTGDRLDLVATLLAAAPWRRLRAAPEGSRALVPIRSSDFRIRKFKQRQEQSIIFAVDASGSMAAQRLGEAKGAVEQLLAEAYVTRAHAALIAFRQSAAEVLLPPTRSLAHAKRRLASLPGGGATPLASAIEIATRLAVSEQARRRTPMIVFLTDGRGNVSRTGAPGRAEAEQDALAAADALRSTGVDVVLIDTSPQARAQAEGLAARMGAAYAALPFVSAGRVADIVRAHAPRP